MKVHLVILAIVLLWGKTQAQQLNIDSLQHQLATARHDTGRVQKMWWLSFAFDAVSHDSAKAYAEKSLHLSRTLHYKLGEARALERLAQSYWIVGDYPKSLIESFNGLQIAQESGSHRQVIRCLNNMGNVYLDLKDYSKAIAYFKQALNLNMEKERGDYSFEQVLKANLAATYQRKKQLDSAWYYVQESYHSKRNGFAILYTHYIYTSIGSIQFDRGNYPDAFSNIRKSISINQAAADRRLLAEAQYELAKFFRILNQPDSAVHYAKYALTNAQSVGNGRSSLDASTLLADLLETKNTQEALKYYKIAKAVNEGLYGADKVLGLQRIIADEQERQRKAENAQLAFQNQIRQYALLAGIGVFLLIALIQYHNNRQKQKANSLLHRQKDEINRQRHKAENALTELKVTQTQLIQREKMASLGELTAGIAHEIQNPLNFVNNFSEVSVELVEELEEEAHAGRIEEVKAISSDLRQNLQRITQNGQRASNIVRGMLEHSRASTGERQPTDLNALCNEYLRLAYQGVSTKDNTFNCDLKMHFAPDLPLVSVVASDISRVLINLFNNAFYAVSARGRYLQGLGGLTGLEAYQPTVSVSTAIANGKVEIRVRDNGMGIPDSIKAKIFQPFFTTKPTGEGTGLGLSLSYDIIIKGHGGTMEVESVEGEGTTFLITLPR